MNKSRNGGFTLVELLVTITIGIIVTFAATTVLLLCLRVHNQSSATATQQNEIRVGLTVMENILAENTAKESEDANEILKADDSKLLYFVPNESGDQEAGYPLGTIFSGAGAPILSDVGFSGFVWDTDKKVVSWTVAVGGESFSASVYCRMTAQNDGAQVLSAWSAPAYGAASGSEPAEPDVDTLIAEAVSNPNTSWQVRKFLSNLTSQLGSTGRIQTEAGEEKYYSEWYIGSYEENPGWSGDTPWCACYVSWALEESGGCLKGATPRFANVDSFWADFVTTERWKTEEPMPGDVIFFDWIADESYNPQHVGVVLTVRNGWVYTIEGNSNGKVAVCKYAPDDPHILGYGLLNWN